MTGPELSPESRWTLVSTLMDSLSSTNNGLGSVPGLIKQVLETGAWREFPSPVGAPAKHERFEEFVTTPAPRGLGASLDQLRRLAGNDNELHDLLNQAAPSRQGTRSDLVAAENFVDNIHEVERPTGNSRDAGLRYLRKNRPDLHAEVLANRLTVNRAMEIAGARPPKMQIRLDDMRLAANALTNRLGTRELYELIRVLVDRLGTRELYELMQALAAVLRRDDADEDAAPVEGTAPMRRQKQKQNGAAPPKRTTTATRPRRRFTEDEIREIRHLASQGVFHRVIAQKFDSSESAVGDIVRRESYANVPDAPNTPAEPDTPAELAEPDEEAGQQSML